MSRREKYRKLGKLITLWITMGIVTLECPTIANAPIVTDANAPISHQALIQETANGVPLVNIATPNQAGVSRNDYTQFNVPKQGAILNNSYKLTQTELAGYVQGNSNMMRGVARVIVNEVTSANPTHMNGFLEVAGNRASVVVANPNGIIVNGGGFINTSQAMLTTGKPTYNELGQLDNINVNRGNVLVEGSGLDVRQTDKIAILTKAMQVNAGIWADDLQIRTGVQSVDYHTLDSEKNKSQEKKGLALDVGAIGGMYANRITMIGTDKGLGVNIAGIVSGTEAISLSVNGDLQVSGTLYSGGTQQISAHHISNSQTIGSLGHMDIKVKKQLDNSGIIASGIDETGNITKESNLHIASPIITNNNARMVAGGSISIAGNTLQNNHGYMGAKGNAQISVTNASNVEGQVLSEKEIAFGAAEDINNTKGQIVGGQQASVKSKVLINLDGNVNSGQNTSLAIDDKVINTRGAITSEGDVFIVSKDIQLDGTIAANHDVSIVTDSNISNRTAEDNHGITQAGNDLTIKTNGAIDNVKAISADGAVALQAKTVLQTKDAEINGENVDLKTDHMLNYGLVSADSGISISAQHVENIETGRIYGDSVSIEAGALENYKNKALEKQLQEEMEKLKIAEENVDKAFAVDITRDGSEAGEKRYREKIAQTTRAYNEQLAVVEQIKNKLSQLQGATIAGRDSVLVQADTFSNRENSLVYSNGDMHIKATDMLENNGARIEAIGSIQLDAPDIINRNSAFSANREITKELKQPDYIRIEQINHPEKGQSFDSREFSSLGSGYGALHNNGATEGIDLLEHVTYEPIEQLPPDVIASGEDPIPPDLIGTMPPQSAYSELFAKVGVQPLPTERPATNPDNPMDLVVLAAQQAWDEQFKRKIVDLNQAIDRYNNKLVQDHKSLQEKKIHRYVIERRHTIISEKKVKTTNAGTIQSGGNLLVNGKFTSENSRVIAGEQLKVTGEVNNIADENQRKEDIFGTDQFSDTYRRPRPHKARRRRYSTPVAVTPTVTLGDKQSLQVSKWEGDTNTPPSGQTITEKKRDDVARTLDPFSKAISEKTSTNNDTSNGAYILELSSMQRLHPESTSRYLIETDSRFTNKKQYLSSDYMIQQLAWNPERVMKKLGDGFYEQGLVREQIVNQLGRRYLTNYADDEGAYKALMDKGIAYAKEHNLTMGVRLSKEQMAALTSDIVWLEETSVIVNGQIYTVLYLKVYLRANDTVTLQNNGTIMSANELVIDTKSSVHNEGLLTGNRVLVQGGDLVNVGNIRGNTIALHSTGNIKNIGNIAGRDRVQLTADNNISIHNTVKHYAHNDSLDSIAGIAVTGESGVLLVGAKNNVSIQGAVLEQLGDKGSTILKAGNDITIDVNTLRSDKDMTLNRDNYLRTYNQTDVGTDITGMGNVTIAAGHNINVKATNISSQKEGIALVAGNDINIMHGLSKSNYDFGMKTKTKGLLSSSTTTVKTTERHTGVIGSTISGEQVLVQAGNNIDVVASNIVGTDAVNVSAGKSIRTNSAEQYDYSKSDIRVKKSGIMRSGMGIMIGTQKTQDQQDSSYITQVETKIGSTNGGVQITAGDKVHLTTTDIVGKEGIAIVAQDITMDGNHNKETQHYLHKEKTSGLTISLGGSAMTAVDKSIQYKNKAKNRKDSRLMALETYEAGKALRDAGKDIGNIKEAPQEAKNKLINIHVGVGSSSSKFESIQDKSTYAGSNLASDGTVKLMANSNIANKGNMQIIGSNIQADDVKLWASHNVDLMAGQNEERFNSNSKSSGWSAGAIVGSGASGFIGVEASAHASKGTENGNKITHAGSTIVGNKSVIVTTGDDLNIYGSSIRGERIKANVGNNLIITSLQDQELYTSCSNVKGFNISTTFANRKPEGSAYSNRERIDSDYVAVTNQSGIYAGNSGFDIVANGDVSLVGGVIDSQADKSHNHIKAKDIHLKDIENHAEYKVSSKNTGVSTDNINKFNPIGLSQDPSIPISDSASSVTRSAIKDSVFDVENIGSASKVNTDTRNALQKLDPIFDKQTVEERKALVNLIAEEGFKAIGDIAVSKRKELLEKSKEAKDAQNFAKADQYRKESKKWEDGGTYKVGLHTVFGGIVSKMAGKGFSSGASSAGLNELAQKELSKIKDPELHKLASYAIGKAVSRSSTGAEIARTGTQFNWLTHEEQQQMLHELWAAMASENESVRNRKLQEIYGKYFALSNFRVQKGYGTELDKSEIIDGSLTEALEAWVQDPTVFDKGLNYTLSHMVNLSPRAVSYANYVARKYHLGEYDASPNAYVPVIKRPESENTLLRKYDNKGDYYADHGAKVIQVDSQNRYVLVDNIWYYTTWPAQYSANQMGDFLADHYYPVVLVNLPNGSTMHAVHYNGQYYFANRELTNKILDTAYKYQGDKTAQKLERIKSGKADSVSLGPVTITEQAGLEPYTVVSENALWLDVTWADAIKSLKSVKSKKTGNLFTKYFDKNVYSKPDIRMSSDETDKGIYVGMGSLSLGGSTTQRFDEDLDGIHIKIKSTEINKTGVHDITRKDIRFDWYDGFSATSDSEPEGIPLGGGIGVAKQFKSSIAIKKQDLDDLSIRFKGWSMATKRAIALKHTFPKDGDIYIHKESGERYFVKHGTTGYTMVVDDGTEVVVAEKVLTSDYRKEEDQEEKYVKK